VSWTLASYGLLGLALLAGAIWYERSHPSARVLALVATLAALAALGRIAFAPVPNVKPTTDIVLLAGFALGGAPGFMVGAVAALTSNFFFGQGPWTPWEMVAWGGAGLAGAVLARVTGGRMGRLPLAATCFVAGFAYGAVMDLSLAVTYGGGRDVGSRWLFFSSTSLPFNLAHAVGNGLFALAFGPALLSALRRYRRRFEVTWLSAPSAAALLLVAVAITSLGAPSGARAASPAGFLARAQNRDGGFGDRPGLGSAPTFTAWATLGLAAQGHNPADVRRHGGRSALDYARRGARSLSIAGDIERALLVAGAAGVSARHFGGRDLIGALLRHRRHDGSFDSQVNLTAFAVLGLRGAGVGVSSPTVRAAARWLTRQENSDGGFNFLGRGGGSDIDDTGAVLQALAAAHSGGATSRRAAAFVAHRQNRDGGFPANPGGASNAQSTAWAIQGLIASGHDPARLHRHGAHSPLSYLHSLIAPDGSVRYSRTSSQDPVWVTGQAALALARAPFPLRRVARRAGARTAASATGAGRSSSAAGGGAAGGGRHATPADGRAARSKGAGGRDARAGGTSSRLAVWSAAAGRLAGLLLAPSTPPHTTANR
jgi:energy-coupling factor transport system substrate-specific component